MKTLCADALGLIFSYLVFDDTKMKTKDKKALHFMVFYYKKPIFYDSFVKIDWKRFVKKQFSPFQLHKLFSHWICETCNMKKIISFPKNIHLLFKRVKCGSNCDFSKLALIKTDRICLSFEPKWNEFKYWIEHCNIKNICFLMCAYDVEDFIRAIPHHHWNEMEFVSDIYKSHLNEESIMDDNLKNLQTCEIIRFRDCCFAHFPKMKQKYNIICDKFPEPPFEDNYFYKTVEPYYLIFSNYRCSKSRTSKKSVLSKTSKQEWNVKYDPRNQIISDTCLAIKYKCEKQHRQEKTHQYKNKTYFTQIVDHWIFFYKQRDHFQIIKNFNESCVCFFLFDNSLNN